MGDTRRRGVERVIRSRNGKIILRLIIFFWLGNDSRNFHTETEALRTSFCFLRLYNNSTNSERILSWNAGSSDLTSGIESNLVTYWCKPKHIWSCLSEEYPKTSKHVMKNSSWFSIHDRNPTCNWTFPGKIVEAAAVLLCDRLKINDRYNHRSEQLINFCHCTDTSCNWFDLRWKSHSNSRKPKAPNWQNKNVWFLSMWTKNLRSTL